MKHKNAKPTRARQTADSAPQTYRCTCGHVSLSKYAHKSHRDICNG